MQLQTDRKYLISSVPQGVDTNLVIQNVLIPSLLLLEQGEIVSHFAVSNKIEKFCGTIFSLLGDHNGQIEISGLKSATSSYPSRYFLTPLANMNEVVPYEQKIPRSDGKHS